MNTRLLLYFLTTSETAHVTKAAQRLGISQSALSQQLKQLEKNLGTRLFERHKQGVNLTAAGQAFRPYAQRALAELQEGKMVVQELEQLERGHLTIGIVQSVNLNLMPAVVGRFGEHFPEVSLNIIELPSNQVEPSLLSSNIDVGVGFIWPEQDDIYSEPLFSEDMLLVVSKSHPLWLRKTIKVRELDHAVMVDAMPGSTRIWQDACEQAGITTKTVAQMTSIASAIASVRYLKAATVIPAMALVDMNQPSIKGIPLVAPKPTRQIGFLWRKHQYRSKLSLHLAQMMRETVRKLKHPFIRALEP